MIAGLLILSTVAGLCIFAAIRTALRSIL